MLLLDNARWRAIDVLERVLAWLRSFDGHNDGEVVVTRLTRVAQRRHPCSS